MLRGFDFTGLSTHAPQGLKVLQADKECLRLHHQTSKRELIVTGDGRGSFELHTKSIVDEPNGNESFVIRTDNLHRLLSLVGYAKPKAQRQVKPTLSFIENKVSDLDGAG